MAPSFTTVASAAAVSLLLFSQPCPAPLILAPLAAIGAGGAAAGGTAAVGAAAGVVGAGIGAAALANDIANNKRDLGSEAGRIWESMNLCAAYIAYSGNVSVTTRAGFTQFENCPSVCGDAINDYNRNPDTRFGTVAWNNGVATVDLTAATNPGTPDSSDSTPDSIMGSYHSGSGSWTGWTPRGSSPRE